MQLVRRRALLYFETHLNQRNVRFSFSENSFQLQIFDFYSENYKTSSNSIDQLYFIRIKTVRILYFQKSNQTVRHSMVWRVTHSHTPPNRKSNVRQRQSKNNLMNSNYTEMLSDGWWHGCGKPRTDKIRNVKFVFLCGVFPNVILHFLFMLNPFFRWTKNMRADSSRIA